LRCVGEERNRLKVLHHVVLQIERRAVEHVRAGMTDRQCVAVGRRARDPANAQAAACPSHVLDHDGLAERTLHVLDEHTRQWIGRAAGRERHHEGDRPRRIGLRPRDMRHCQQRGSTRCQMQKLSAGKFDF
jgi:hypothetical protein